MSFFETWMSVDRSCYLCFSSTICLSAPFSCPIPVYPGTLSYFCLDSLPMTVSLCIFTFSVNHCSCLPILCAFVSITCCLTHSPAWHSTVEKATNDSPQIEKDCTTSPSKCCEEVHIKLKQLKHTTIGSTRKLYKMWKHFRLYFQYLTNLH